MNVDDHRMPFGSVSDIPRIVVEEQISKFGFCVLHSERHDEQMLLDLASRFGAIQRHDRSKVNGIVDVTSDPRIHGQDYPSHEGIGRQKFEPHTDGAFLNDYVVDSKGLVHKISRPKYLMLQCVKQAGEGGDSILIDGKAAYELVKLNNTEMLFSLSSEIFHFLKKDEIIRPRPTSVFRRIKNGNMSIRFRRRAAIVDGYIGDEDRIRQHLSDFFTNYLNDESCVSTFLLRPGDILIVDNYRILHGRNEFPPQTNRHLRRIWISASGSSPLDHSPSPTGISPSTDDYRKSLLSNFRTYDSYPNPKGLFSPRIGIAS